MKESNAGRGLVARLPLFAMFAAACFAVSSQAQISQYLPFNMPSTSELRSSPKKVFAHYFTPYPVSIDNKQATNDYYTVNYLNPAGEGGIHAGYGGFLRQRPLPRPPRPESNWQSLDAQAEVRLAIDIGLDGFTVDLLSGQIDRVQRMMDAANAVDPGFKIVLMPDMNSITTSNSLVSIVQTLAAYPAAYRLADGRLVVSPFNAQKQTASWWAGWLSSMSSRGINIAFVPLFQGWRNYASAYQSISYGYSDWGDRTAVNNTSASWLNAASDARQYVNIWMHPVAPQDVRPREQKYWEAANGTLFRNTWEFGSINKADWVQLITWNDYSEEAEIVPSTGIQHLFYDLSAYYVYWFKKGTPPPIARDCIYYSHRQHSTTAQPDLTKQTEGAFTIANSSPSNHLEATVFLTANATLEIEIAGVTTQHTVTAPRSIVKVPLQQGQPIFRLIRSGQTIASVQSPFPINNTITYQDFLYHGGSSLRPPVAQVKGAYWPRNPTFPPSAPTGLTATAGSLQVALSWTAPSGATGYNVKRATTSGGPYTQIASPTSASYTDTTVMGGTTYYYVVSAKNSGGESANSAQVSATPTGGPDLIVTGISWSPANPVDGDAVTFSATIKNQGSTATPAGVIHGVSFLVNGTQVNWSDTSTDSLAAGASRTVTANGGPNSTSTWPATTGTHSILAHVDDINRIAETNENNNTLTSSMVVSAGLPDLIVTAISWSPANPVEGQAVTFSATIKNQGAVATPANVIHGVGFLVDGVQVNWSDTSSNSLAAGASRTVTANSGPGNSSTWTATLGTHSVRAFVDDVNRIAESNEANNNLTNSMTVVAGVSDLIVTGISWSPSSPVSGDPVTFSATIKNQGNGATPANVIHGVSFWVDGTQVSWSDTSSNSLAPGATRTLTVNSGPGGSSVWTASSGSHSVRAFVDDVNRITESNETNNNLTNTVNVAALPPPWQTADIGAVGAVGNASYSGGTFTVDGSGADIWGTADEFRYVYQLASGDCTIVARVTAVENTDVWAKAGVMIRESLATGSAHAFCLVSPGSGVSFQRRTATAGTTAATTTTGLAPPHWVRVVRSGSTFTASVSPDGVRWTTQGSATITMATSVYIGLAVTSHLDGTLCTATVANVTATP